MNAALSAIDEVREAEQLCTDRRGRSFALFSHDGWCRAFPWIIQGVTGRSADADYDLGLAGDQSVSVALGRWWTVRDALGARGLLVARQVHGRAVLNHALAFDGLQMHGPADGHVTSVPGLLLSITVADCVPIFVVDAASRAVAVLHAGWRGIAAGILEAGLGLLPASTGAIRDSVHIHLGPSICAACYPVGPEVFDALGLMANENGPAHVDLRRVLSERAVRAGVPPANVSRSTWCTRCDRNRFFSHRGGDAGRQIGVLGLRTDA